MFDFLIRKFGRRTVAAIPNGEFMGRSFFRDDAYRYRMGAGFAGEVNRTHPASIEPTLNDVTSPVLGFGLGVTPATSGNGVRQIAAGDTAITKLYGISVRSFPFQQQTATNYGAIGYGASIPATGELDVLTLGYIMVPYGGAGTPKKGDPVFMWVAAASGAHVQGGFESVVSGGSTTAAALSNVVFNGPPDVNGLIEVKVIV